MFQILKKYGIGATFHLNSSLFGVRRYISRIGNLGMHETPADQFEAKSFHLVFDNAEILAARWCGAMSVSANADTVVNITNIGSSVVAGYNHAAICGNTDNNARLTVNLINAENGRLILSRQDLVAYETLPCETLAKRIENAPVFRFWVYIPVGNDELGAFGVPVACNETVALFANGEAANPMRLLTLTQQYIAPMPDPEPTPAPQNDTNDPVSASLCNWDNVDHGTTFFGRITKIFHTILWHFSHLLGRK